jgi:hypothetical protein
MCMLGLTLHDRAILTDHVTWLLLLWKEVCKWLLLNMWFETCVLIILIMAPICSRLEHCTWTTYLVALHQTLLNDS